MAGLVETERPSAWDPQRGHQAEALVTDVGDELRALGSQLLDRRGDVIAHEIELVPARVRGAGRVHAHFGGWKPEDQPAVAGVDVPQPEDVAEELPGAVGVVRIDDGMRSDNHDSSSCCSVTIECGT